MLEELALVPGGRPKPCLWRRPASQSLQMAMTTPKGAGLALLEQQLKPLLPASLQVLEGQFAPGSPVTGRGQALQSPCLVDGQGADYPSLFLAATT